MTFSIANDEFFDIGKPDFLNFFDLSFIKKVNLKSRFLMHLYKNNIT